MINIIIKSIAIFIVIACVSLSYVVNGPRWAVITLLAAIIGFLAVDIFYTVKINKLKSHATLPKAKTIKRNT